MYFKLSKLHKLISPYKHKSFRFFCNNNHNALKPPWSVIFFGTDKFSLSSLQALNNEFKQSNLFKRLEVVTTPKNNPIRKYATEKGLIIHDWPLKSLSKENKFHIGLVVSFGHLIPPDVINMFPMGILNVHASLLPRWRGAAPIIYAIANGDKTTGISIMKIKPLKFDVGEIIRQEELPISSDIKMPELYDQLSHIGAQNLIKSLKELPQSLENAIPQMNDGITYAPRVNSTLAVIDFSKQSTQTIYNLGRALTGLYPLSTIWNGVSVKLHDICIHSNTVNNTPGFAVYDKSENIIKIQCLDGCISTNKIGVINKKIMNATEFNNGYLKKQPLDYRIFR